jgi:hypothetical protein
LTRRGLITPNKRSQKQQVSGWPCNRKRHQGWKARLAERPNVPYAYLPPEKISAHQRAYCCGRGDQQKHLRAAGKPIHSAALKHSSPRRQHHKNKLETLWKHSPIEILEKHCCIVVEVASTLQHQDLIKEYGNAKDTNCQGYHEENSATKPEDSSREAPDQQAGRP